MCIAKESKQLLTPVLESIQKDEETCYLSILDERGLLRMDEMWSNIGLSGKNPIPELPLWGQPIQNALRNQER